jgi:hypothetical protein
MKAINAFLTHLRGRAVSPKQAHRLFIGDTARRKTVEGSPVKRDKRGRRYARPTELERFIRLRLMP